MPNGTGSFALNSGKPNLPVIRKRAAPPFARRRPARLTRGDVGGGAEDVIAHHAMAGIGVSQ
jgi:hypothetical protein